MQIEFIKAQYDVQQLLRLDTQHKIIRDICPKC